MMNQEESKSFTIEEDKLISKEISKEKSLEKTIISLTENNNHTD